MVQVNISAGYSIWQLMQLCQFFTVATQLLPSPHFLLCKGRKKSGSWALIILRQNTFPDLQTLRLSRSESKLCACNCCPILCGWWMKDKPFISWRGETCRLWLGRRWWQCGFAFCRKMKWRKLGSQRTQLKSENEILTSASPSLELVWGSSRELHRFVLEAS